MVAMSSRILDLSCKSYDLFYNLYFNMPLVICLISKIVNNLVI